MGAVAVSFSGQNEPLCAFLTLYKHRPPSIRHRGALPSRPRDGAIDACSGCSMIDSIREERFDRRSVRFHSADSLGSRLFSTTHNRSMGRMITIRNKLDHSIARDQLGLWQTYGVRISSLDLARGY